MLSTFQLHGLRTPASQSLPAFERHITDSFLSRVSTLTRGIDIAIQSVRLSVTSRYFMAMA